jgi:hypothetical protein
VLEQQSHPFQIVPVGFSQQQRREAVGVEPAAVEQDAKNDGVPRFGKVVRRLFVVWVGPALEEQARDAGVLRDAGSSIDCALDDLARRRVDRLVPASVRIGAGVEQRSRRAAAIGSLSASTSRAIVSSFARFSGTTGSQNQISLSFERSL